MKKVFDKIISITLGVISLFFVVLMLVTTFGGLEQADLDNNVVKALLITLGAIFVVLTVMEIAVSFRDDEKLNAILLYKDRDSSTKATVSVVKKTAKRVAKTIKTEAKVGKVQIVSDDAGNTRLKVDVKILTDRTEETAVRLRAILVESFKKIFGIEFASIDFRVVKSKSAYLPAEEEIKARISELKSGVESDDRIQPDDGIIIPEGGDTHDTFTAAADETESNAASEVTEVNAESEAEAAEEGADIALVPAEEENEVSSEATESGLNDEAAALEEEK